MKNLKTVELYLVIDREICDSLNFSVVEVAKEAVDAGVDLIQYRDKVSSIEEYEQKAKEVFEVCKKGGVPFLVNDFVEVAKNINADGIHVGQSDKTPDEIRKYIKNPDFIIGYSTHNFEEIKKALEYNVSYFNIGPIFHTQTKKHLTEFIGTEFISQVRKKYPDKIFTTMGGINKSNIYDVIFAGADRSAVVTAIINNKNSITNNVNDLKNIIKKAKEERNLWVKF